MSEDKDKPQQKGVINRIKQIFSTFLYAGSYNQIRLANELLKQGKAICEKDMIEIPNGHDASTNYSKFTQREKRSSKSLMCRLIMMQGKMWFAYILLNIIPHSLRFCTTYTLKLTINKAEAGMSFPAALALIFIFVVCYGAVDISFLHLFHSIDIGKYKIKSSLVHF
jgi:hypothetical protein